MKHALDLSDGKPVDDGGAGPAAVPVIGPVGEQRHRQLLKVDKIQKNRGGMKLIKIM